MTSSTAIGELRVSSQRGKSIAEVDDAPDAVLGGRARDRGRAPPLDRAEIAPGADAVNEVIDAVGTGDRALHQPLVTDVASDPLDARRSDACGATRRRPNALPCGDERRDEATTDEAGRTEDEDHCISKRATSAPNAPC
jgi:hypothetical protein